MSRQNEKLVKTKITKVLREHDIWYFFPQGTLYGRRGIPDILALHAGTFLAIEAKSGRNKPTEAQKRQLLEIRRHGGLSLVVNEENLDAFTDLIAAVVQSPTHAAVSYFRGRWPTLTKLFDTSREQGG